MYYKTTTFNNNILISLISSFTISITTIKINIIHINFITNLTAKLNTNFSNITSYKVTLSYNNKPKTNIISKFIIKKNNTLKTNFNNDKIDI